MRLYETGLIFNPQLDEAEYDSQIKKVTSLIESNSGKIEKVDRWGIRNMAYEIKKKTQGFYVFVYYNAPPEVPQQLEKVLRINEHCLRFMTIRPDYPMEFEKQDERSARPEPRKQSEPAPKPVEKSPEAEKPEESENNEPKEDL